jgi:hypothetical protein
MGKSALGLIPTELQGVAMEISDLSRAVALVSQTNQMVREAADARLRFENEPSAYTVFLREEVERG